MKCRNCKKKKLYQILDLGIQPLANEYRNIKDKKKEQKFPLILEVCSKCWLVQTSHKIQKEKIFRKNYSYFSSYSKSWLEHCKKFTDEMFIFFKKKINILEIACNDGYLLQFFNNSNLVNKCLGVEPTNSTAKIAKKKKIKVIQKFFNYRLSKQIKKNYGCFDLIILNNVIAHTPEFHSILKGVEDLLSINGLVTFEFPHVVEMIKKSEFDTIYHEHYSYFSFYSFQKILRNNNLKIFKVKKLKTHGGSLRVYATKNISNYKVNISVNKLIKYEKKIGINKLKFYKNFHDKAHVIKKNFLHFLENLKKKNQSISAYGAAAKGNTFINFLKLTSKDISFVIDLNPNKQNKFLPGSQIPIKNISYYKKKTTKFILIVPWNLKNEIFNQLKKNKELKKVIFLTAIPKINFLNAKN
jgi:2-polyprenyl-3-methyl-5-hydroxy-6-metoxy-1,4-benzoquinol methylase